MRWTCSEGGGKGFLEEGALLTSEKEQREGSQQP